MGKFFSALLGTATVQAAFALEASAKAFSGSSSKTVRPTGLGQKFLKRFDDKGTGGHDRDSGKLKMPNKKKAHQNLGTGETSVEQHQIQDHAVTTWTRKGVVPFLAAAALIGSGPYLAAGMDVVEMMPRSAATSPVVDTTSAVAVASGVAAHEDQRQWQNWLYHPDVMQKYDRFRALLQEKLYRTARSDLGREMGYFIVQVKELMQDATVQLDAVREVERFCAHDLFEQQATKPNTRSRSSTTASSTSSSFEEQQSGLAHDDLKKLFEHLQLQKHQMNCGNAKDDAAPGETDTPCPPQTESFLEQEEQQLIFRNINLKLLPEWATRAATLVGDQLQGSSLYQDMHVCANYFVGLYHSEGSVREEQLAIAEAKMLDSITWFFVQELNPGSPRYSYLGKKLHALEATDGVADAEHAGRKMIQDMGTSSQEGAGQSKDGRDDIPSVAPQPAWFGSFADFVSAVAAPDPARALAYATCVRFVGGFRSESSAWSDRDWTCDDSGCGLSKTPTQLQINFFVPESCQGKDSGDNGYDMFDGEDRCSRPHSPNTGYCGHLSNSFCDFNWVRKQFQWDADF
ncbi:unnamed protein product [Amoebophrya sp. A120]|nr:unnamed protein product [Amoebophrya sp. A120]|eukprot:GSA120T00009280001.1